MYNKYNNQIKFYRNKLGNEFGYRNKIKPKGGKEGMEQLEDIKQEIITTTNEDEEIISKLKEFFPPYNVFINSWDKVYHIRNQDYNLEFKDIISKWPVFENTDICYHLVII